MPRQTFYIWKQAPFLRLVIPFMAGIALQWYGAWPVWLSWLLCLAGITGMYFFNRRATFRQFKDGWVNGILINTLLVSAGLLTTYYKDARHRQNWMNHYYQNGDMVTVTLEEPLTEKANSFKATASVQLLVHGILQYPVSGHIIIYFKKDFPAVQPGYGTQLVFNKPLQPIKNTGNPGSFDYERYAAFLGIYQQVFLLPEEYKMLPLKNENQLWHFLFHTQKTVLQTLTAYIPGKKEAGLAEALLLGYRDDLDKTLVQSYSNTGVVHIIAISGMHLGLIYWLLNILLSPLKKRKQTKWLLPLLVITGLWLFSLLVGGGPSILRSAVMFTCIVAGESAQRKTFIYNSLAASAFILLCINPFWLWNAGFQLSYSAVLGIVIFMKPFYNWIGFKNKLVAGTWKMVAISLAAQVLTTPVSLYHFHQFPVYFLVTNIPAVPLSGIIVLLEIALCLFAPLPALAIPAGLFLHHLIYTMNSFIEYMESLPFSLWSQLQVNEQQVVLLYALIVCLSWWLMKKNKIARRAGLFFLLVFLFLRTVSFIRAGRRCQLVVYNIPRHQAIDFVNGRQCFFKGDASMVADPLLKRLYLQPARTLFRTTGMDSLGNLLYAPPVFLFNNKKIALIEKALHFNTTAGKITVDLIVVSRNPSVRLTELAAVFDCRELVFDASCSAGKVNKWKAEAAKLGLHCFYTVDNGAFVMKMD
ncbi:MAG: ComEC/Rec2 family competence protein [Bacteroidota bacterium]